MEEKKILLKSNQMPTQDDFIEFQKSVRTVYSKVCFIVAIIGALVFGTAEIILYVNDAKINPMQTFVVILLLIYMIFMNCFMYRIVGKTRYKQNVEMHSSDNYVIVYEDCITKEMNNVEVQKLKFSDIKKVTETKNLIVLKFDRMIYTFVTKKNFSEDNLKEFKRILGI